MNEQTTMMNQQQQQQQQLMNLNHSIMNSSQINSQPQPQMVPMNRGYGIWPPQPQFQNPNPGAMKPPSSSFKKSLGPRNNWKGKKVNKLNDQRRNELQKFQMSGSTSGGVNTIGGGSLGNLKFNNYQPPTLNELQHQNRLKTRKFFPKKKFNKNPHMNMNMPNNNSYYGNNSRSAPLAPRNTTSFIIRAKKSGGIASLVSPSPMTPAVLPTPIFSPSREVLVDMAKEEWGVDGYGSMKGLIRLRSPGHVEDEEEDEGGSSESDVEEHVEVERRLDHDLSRFEMIYDPNNIGGADYQNVLENRVDDQDTHIAHLEEENLILKERLFLMERELADLRRRMHYLERRGNKGEINDEVVENDSENESGSRGEGTHSMEDNNELNDDNFVHIDGVSKEQGADGLNSEGFDTVATVDKSVVSDFGKVVNYDSCIAVANLDRAKNKEGLKGMEKTNNNDSKCADVEVETDSIVEDKGESNNDDTEENNHNDENKCLDVEVKAEDNADMQSFEEMEKDTNMEEAGVSKANMGLQGNPAN